MTSLDELFPNKILDITQSDAYYEPNSLMVLE